MKNLSVSKEMILIALCGVLTGVIGVFKSVIEIIDHEYICAHSYYYFLLVLFYFLVFQVLNQVILWEIVYITFLRASVIMDVRYGMKTENLKRNMRGFVYTLFGIFLLNHFFRIFFHRIDEIEVKEKAPNGCSTTKEYVITAIAGNCLRRILLIIAGVTSLVRPS
uniref:G_PROTEIN_RECEP_F1_2 domain-containing protein n=1 Tax=Caenorhabditis tropicalis TaxID=1561998 RepID=A0A1I7V4C9_9PELO